jgi:putative nucleotidyltransferase with HDIG domain
MNIGIDRDDALKLLKDYIKNENTIRHSLATEVVMRKLAEYFNEDVEAWGIAGLLHDLDLEKTGADLKIHGLETEKILNKIGINPIITETIRMHNEVATKKKRTDRFHIALAAGETITGLIVATTLVYPDKKIKSVKPKSIVKRMKEKSFAASVNREIIRECEKIDIPLADFAKLCLQAMCSIDKQIGL